ncbi:hypothetical protein VA7868_00997 [Vibrio aerogenes CECT 7868]|uniref:Peptidoglycan-binding protein CsiV n=1 Tax=Vibrio aerogenes CECT 7868 TaxID=1216006 RepID=A0A1M5X5Y4_9VIBR|nr:peptidoglycan binding protein CsiV [Vibrio aerogenes]SHH95237.1 hypothetical protein VA7868_00997 [Vibrio aerogenes CECT 7868]
MKKLIPLLMLFIAMPGWAKRQFDIEVIIFKRVADTENTNESWPARLPAIAFNKTGSLNSQSYRAKKGVALLPRSEYKLNAQEQRLNRHAGFHVLLHTAWRQGDQGQAYAPAFHIQAGKNFASVYRPDGRELASSLSHSPVEGVIETSIPKALYELDGKLQVYVQHYLYADAVFDLKIPGIKEISVQDIPVDTSSDAESNHDTNIQLGHLQSINSVVTEEKFLQPYRLNQKRRMRSGETIYFDHPLMGIILQVRKVTQ